MFWMWFALIIGVVTALVLAFSSSQIQRAEGDMLRPPAFQRKPTTSAKPDA